MATYLDKQSGRTRQIQPINTSTGAPDGAKIIETDGTGRIDLSLLPLGVGVLAQSIPLADSISVVAGDYVYVDSNGRVRLASASSEGQEAVGYVLSSVGPGDAGGTVLAMVYFEDFNSSVTGLTPGARQYLSATTPGKVTETPPSGTGQVCQFLGNAISATLMMFEPDDGIILA